MVVTVVGGPAGQGHVFAVSSYGRGHIQRRVCGGGESTSLQLRTPRRWCLREDRDGWFLVVQAKWVSLKGWVFDIGHFVLLVLG